MFKTHNLEIRWLGYHPKYQSLWYPISYLGRLSGLSKYLPTLVITPFSSSIGKVHYILRGFREKALACSSQLAVAASDLNASKVFHLAHYVGQGVRQACYYRQGWNHSLTLDEPNIMGTGLRPFHGIKFCGGRFNNLKENSCSIEELVTILWVHD